MRIRLPTTCSCRTERPLGVVWLPSLPVPLRLVALLSVSALLMA